MMELKLVLIAFVMLNTGQHVENVISEQPDIVACAKAVPAAFLKTVQEYGQQGAIGIEVGCAVRIPQLMPNQQPDPTAVPQAPQGGPEKF